MVGEDLMVLRNILVTAKNIHRDIFCWYSTMLLIDVHNTNHVFPKYNRQQISLSLKRYLIFQLFHGLTTNILEYFLLVLRPSFINRGA